MEGISKFNTRILIGQELGEIYLMMQQYINNKWQYHPNHKYRGNYFVNKKIKELLKYDIQNVRKGAKNDLVKFKIAENVYVYINDYSVIKDYPELKNLNKVIMTKIICQKLSNNMILVKNKQQLKDSSFVRIALTSVVSLGVIGIATSLNIENEEHKISNQLDNMEQFASRSEIGIISNTQKNSYNVDDILGDLNQFQKMKTINNLTSQAISEYKINDNFIIEMPISENDNGSEITNIGEDSIIQRYADMYFMDYNQASKIYFDNYEEIISSDNGELIFLLKIKDAFYADSSIDKKPIITNMNSEEKEAYIINIAKDVYKIEDEEIYALLLAIHRLEADNGTSRRCIEDNNPGGLREGGSFLKFKSFEIGAECFVRNVQNIINDTKNMPDYNYDLSFEENMQTIYCDGDNDWGIQVKNIKDSILENNELEEYLETDNTKNKKYVKIK